MIYEEIWRCKNYNSESLSSIENSLLANNPSFGST